MSHLTSDDLRQAFAAGTEALAEHRDAINALNVFPVPDGDTGTNMLLTMRTTMEHCPTADGKTIGEVAHQLADGAFWGARGNSGVILSQFLKGFTQAFQSLEVGSGSDLSRAFHGGQEAAYGAVGKPVEGTMLTVMASMALAVQASLDGDGEEDPRILWQTAFESGKEATALTPTQLPVLREAGVVDAGGMGVVVFLGGALGYLKGHDDQELASVVAGGYLTPSSGSRPSLDADYLDSVEHSDWGYCTQFVISGESLFPEVIRADFAEMSDSAVVMGDEEKVRVHVHLLDPGPALSYGAALGQLGQIDIQNMTEQNQGFVAGHRETPKGEALAVVAVALGDGFANLFREIGCSAVVNGGQTMNPSVKEILDAVQAVGAEDTIILPNNKNVAFAAQQAAEMTPGVHVVASESAPQGVAAMLAFNPAEPVEQNLSAMDSARLTVVTIEVTQAVRPVAINGLQVAEDDYIGLRDRDLVAVGETPKDALVSVLEMIDLSDDSIVTLYLGADTPWEDGEGQQQELESKIPGIQVDLVYGGQPHYHYLASVE